MSYLSTFPFDISVCVLYSYSTDTSQYSLARMPHSSTTALHGIPPPIPSSQYPVAPSNRRLVPFPGAVPP
jgi:hypothetical protein